MHDITDQLRRYGDATERAALHHASARSVSLPPERSWRRPILAGAAMAIALVAGLSALNYDRGTTVDADGTMPSVVTNTSKMAPTQPDALDGVVRHDEIPLPEWLGPRLAFSLVWTGDELIIWGGWRTLDGNAVADGAAFNPASGAWRRLSSSPLSPRGHHVAVWTGSRMIVTSGLTDPTTLLDDGASYDPTTDTWAPTAATGVTSSAPLPLPPEAVWTGKALVLWYRAEQTVTIYDPATDTWSAKTPPQFNTPLPDAVLRWTGTEVVALAGSGTGPLQSAMLRPDEAEGWLALPPVAFVRPGYGSDPYPPNSAVAGGRLIVWPRSGGDTSAFSLDASTRSWAEIDPIPAAACEGGQPALSLGDRLVAVDGCGTGALVVFDSLTGAWSQRSLEDDQLSVLLLDGVWTGADLIAIGSCCQSGAVPWTGHRFRID